MNIVKKIGLGDLRIIKDLEKKCFKSNYFLDKEIDDMYAMELYSFWGIWSEGRLVGYIILLNSIDVYEVIKVGVLKEERGKGLGEILLNEILKKVELNIILEVRESNKSARRLYEKIGFESIGIRKKYYKDTMEDAIIMMIER